MRYNDMKKYRKHEVMTEYKMTCISCGHIETTSDEILALLTKYNHEHEIEGTIGSVKK